MSQIIEIIISPTGQTSVQTKGLTGSSCQDASRFIEQELSDRGVPRFPSFVRVRSDTSLTGR